MQTNAGLAGVARHRWWICALLLAATTINYMDRQLIGVLKPLLQQELGWSETDYGNIVLAFQASYGIGLLLAGRALDRVGTRLGFPIAVALWSLAAMSHALARGVHGFVIARFGLGLGEAAHFPAAIKTVAEWFPDSERALATGIFNAGATLGALATPLVVPLIVAGFGWQAAFVVVGGLGFVWIACWAGTHLWLRARHGVTSPLAPVEAARQPTRWRDLLRYRATWAFALGKFLTDPIWWLYLFWLPDFFSRTFHMDLKGLSLPTAAVYVAAGVGSIFGGALSSVLIKRGASIDRGRKVAMLVCALAVTPVWLAPWVTDIWAAVALIGLAAAAHQGWSANLLTLVSDAFPRSTVSSVAGLGGMFGAVGGMLIAWTVAQILQLSGSYVWVFAIAGGAYLVALLAIHLLVPRLQRVEVAEAA